MRVGIAGLNALYWPVAMGNGLVGKQDVAFLAAATLSESDNRIKETLGLSPVDYANRYHITLYDQPEEMIAREKLDTVAIVTRHTEHAHWVERLSRLGMNLFIPKTFVTTAQDADRILQAEKQYGIKVAVGPSARYLVPMVAIKQAIDEWLIGEPFSLRICHHHGTIDVFHANDWYRDPLEGGPELSLGWYGIDLAMQLMNDHVTKVFATYHNYTSPDSPFMDCGRMTMELGRGGTAAFDMLFCNRVDYPSWQVEVVGPSGVISLHRMASDSIKTSVTLDLPDGRRTLPLPEVTPNWEMFWVDEFLQGKPPSVSAEYARKVTLVSLAARESARSGQAVALPT